jgi:hypothetical protein
LALNAARLVKQHLGIPVALVTDSADWLYQQYPNYKDDVDMVIKIVQQAEVAPWTSTWQYPVGSLVFYNGTIWRKVNEGPEVIEAIEVIENIEEIEILRNFEIIEDEVKLEAYVFNHEDFDPVYEGIDIDKWYPNLPYLVGQHVWHENTLYRCTIQYIEGETFSKDKYISLIDHVQDGEAIEEITKGDVVLYARNLWMSKIDTRKQGNYINIDEDNFTKVYEGIDIDKWYPNLPYLVGQHVWHENTLYRCAIQYTEGETFNKDKYISLIDRVQDGEIIEELSKGDVVLYARNLWMSKFNIKKENISSSIEDFEPVYKGIDIDKWYPNLPYLVGQHVWYKNTLYRCHTEYEEKEEFSARQYDIILENVQDGDVIEEITKGDTILFNRSLWMSDINGLRKKEIITNIDIQKTYKIEDNFTRVYEGIDIDKWYPNLPYLVGQHVWYENTLYRCHTEYAEKEEFSSDQYDIVLENVNELTQLTKFTKGDILFHERVLWMSLINYDLAQNNKDKIRYDLWEDTKERFLVYDTTPQYRQYFDGAMTHKKLRFKNDIRVKSFELSPFDETLVIDCDYLINNDILKYCWQQPHDFLIHKQAVDLSGYRYDPRLVTLSDKSIDFYWATVFFFRKNKNTEIFFNYLGHIQENWNYYRYIYQIEQGLYRNDFAFSIAIHAMNGYQDGTWAHDLPGKLYYTIDKDILLEHDDIDMKFLIEKEKYRGEYTIMKTKGINVHVMNKFSIARLLNEELNV